MLADRMLDHRLVGGDDEGGPVGEHEEPHGFERLDRCVWETAVKVVDQHDQPVNLRQLQQLAERLPESLNLLRRCSSTPPA